MESTWAQVLVGMLVVVSPFLGAALGVIVLAYTPLRQPSDEAAARPAPRG